MSNEERNDEQDDVTSDAEQQEGREVDESPEAGGGAEESALEDTTEGEYSYSGQDATSREDRKGGGTSAGIWVIIVLVIAALIAVGWYQWTQSERQAQVEAQQEREQIRERQLGLITEDVQEAAEALETGDVDTMIDRLEAANEQLDIIARAANSAGDTEAAQQITAKRNTINQAISSLEPIYQEIEAKRAEVRELERQLMDQAEASLQAIGSDFNISAPARERPAAPAAPEPVDEPADETADEAEVDEDDAGAEDAEAVEPESPEADDDQPAEDDDAETPAGA